MHPELDHLCAVPGAARAIITRRLCTDSMPESRIG